MSKSNGEREKWRERELKQKKVKHTRKPESFYSKSFPNVLINPDLGMVGKGSALHVQLRGDVASGFVVGWSNVGDPRVLSQEGLVSGERSGLTVCGMVPIC